MNSSNDPRFATKFDPRLAAINAQNRRHYRDQKKVLDHLLKPGPILDLALQRLSYTRSFLRLPASPELALERLRLVRPFEQELLDASKLFSETRFSKAQAERASEERVKIGDNRTPLNVVIRELIRSPEHHDMTVEDLWPHLYSKLEELGCSPLEIPCQSGNVCFRAPRTMTILLLDIAPLWHDARFHR
jgi:hypothetical protein